MQYINWNSCYHFLAHYLLNYGEDIEIRGLKCREVINFNFSIADPKDTRIVWNIPDRQGIYDNYCEKELEWYKSLNLEASSAPSKFWLKLADEEGNITSNYGYMVLGDKKIPGQELTDYMKWPYTGTREAISSFEYALRALENDPFTRQALIHYGKPEHFWAGNKDIPCTITQQFFIRNDALHTIVNMRSSDIWFGLPYDIPWFVWVQKELLRKLNDCRHDTLKLGTYHHNIGSFHLYERNHEDVKNETKLYFDKHDKGVKWEDGVL